MTLNRVSRKASINKSTLHNYLNGVLPQGLVALVKLCELFEVSLDELVFKEMPKAEGLPAEPLKKQNRLEGRFEVIVRSIE